METQSQNSSTRLLNQRQSTEFADNMIGFDAKQVRRVYIWDIIY